MDDWGYDDLFQIVPIIAFLFMVDDFSLLKFEMWVFEILVLNFGRKYVELAW